ncbi:MAG: carbohydrate binding family 9 domain-containing protein, partial [Gemmatimonadetes bacterium]|nr:carbohydrate binding family 9 domain-containing protein [Gemmatimonadota bacterium]
MRSSFPICFRVDRSAVLLACLALLLGSAVPAAAQEASDPISADDGVPTVRASKLQGPLNLDGIPDEEAWSQATPASVFTQLDPFEGAAASEETRVYLLYDDEALYIGAFMSDSSPVSTRLGRRDGWLMDTDWLTVSLDSYNDHRTGFKFEINPDGVRGDEALSGGQDRHGDSSWDPVWEAATSVNEDGWTAEMRIPFSQIRFGNAEEQVWGIQIIRDIARNREKQLFSFTPKDEASGIARYGHLEGIRGLTRPKGLEILPYVQSRAEFVPVSQSSSVDFENPYRDGSDFFYGAGFDLKYGLSSSLTLNATINPDFGQVEVDPAVVNLTAFETRFQEKRPFFVEGAGIFSFGQGGGGGPGGGMRGMFGGGGGGGGPTQLLYSRRIGDRPRGHAPPEAVYSNVPDATTILGAAKLTGQTAGGLSVGFMGALTGTETADFTTEIGQTGEAEVAPLTNFLVARLRQDFRDGQSALGAIGTAVNRDLGAEALAAELRSSAYSGGVDFFHEWANRAWSLSGQVAGSRIAGAPAVITSAQMSSARYFQRPDAQHVRLDPSATSLSGYTGHLELRRQAGLHWRGGAEFNFTSPGFEVNDLGFQRNADRREAEVSLEYQENRPGETFRRWEISAQPQTSWNFDGDRLETQLSIRSNFTWLNYWSTRLSYERTFESMDDRLTRGGPLAKKPSGNQISLSQTSDFSKPISGFGSVTYTWDEAGGSRTSYFASVGIKTSSTWELTLGPRLSINNSVAQYIGTRDDPEATATFGIRYLFADLEQTTLSMDTRLNMTFTPELSLELYAQPFIATGNYETPKELRAPGTFEFNRYGIDGGELTLDEDGDATVDPDGAGPAESFTVYNRDFNRVSLRGTGVLRWEWRPGSTLFFVWQQNRSSSNGYGDFDLGRDVDELFAGDAHN